MLDYKKEYNKKYYQKNCQKLLIWHRDYRKNHKKEIGEYSKKYYQKNKKRINRYMVERRKCNLNARILHCLRSRIDRVLKKKSKSKTTIKLLGCSISELKQYLENRFTKRMNWNNYGSYWEIDHIRPCCSFELSKEREQRKCFYYTNLQPLTIKNNRKKGGEYFDNW